MADRTTGTVTAALAGTIDIGGDMPVNRFGFGAMRITGEGIWGEPADREECKRVLRRALELGINFIDTADSYGPEVSERLIAETYKESVGLLARAPIADRLDAGPQTVRTRPAADRNQVLHAALQRPLKHLLAVGVEFRKFQVSVRIGKHR